MKRTDKQLLRLARKLYSKEGFVRHYHAECKEPGTYKAAFERTEELHVQIFGCRKFVDHAAFKNYLSKNRERLKELQH